MAKDKYGHTINLGDYVGFYWKGKLIDKQQVVKIDANDNETIFFKEFPDIPYYSPAYVLYN